MSDIRLCPHCRIALQSMQLLEDDPIETDVCPSCRGIWFDDGELAAVLAAVKEPDAEVSRHLLTALSERNVVPDSIKYVKCPLCADIMNRQCYGHRSGVVVDRCKGHGVWLDGGELETLFGWVAAGGHILDEQVAGEKQARQKKNDAARRQNPPQIGSSVGGIHVGAGFGGSHGTQFGLGGVLGDLISSFFRR